MRFVFISGMAGAPWGGSEELWSQAALRLSEAGHDVSASIVWWPVVHPKIATLAKSTVQIVRQLPAQSRLYKRAWRRIAQHLGCGHPDLQWLKRQRADLVVISQGSIDCALKWMQFCRDVRLPYVSIVQCNHEGWWPADGSANEMASAYRAARAVFCVSRHNLKLLEYQIGEPLPNAKVVWNPFNVPTMPQMQWPKQERELKLACVARLQPAAKGQDILFQALAKRKWRERPVRLNLYGAGPCQDNLRRLAARLELNDIPFCGHVVSVRAIWEENHMLVLPSRYEGLPLALVEAMWCARPSVVTDVGGNTEVCEDGKTGFVAAAPTVELLDDALERAWARRECWQAMGHAARLRAEQLIPKDPIGDFCRQIIELAERR